MGTKRSLALYLRGHHAAGAAAVGQVRRQAAACRDGELGLLLVRLSREIADDRAHLAEVMTKLGVAPARLRALVARLLGWFGRWFVRAHAPGRPQALLIGLESLSLGIEGKASLWRTLREVAVAEPRIGDIDFDALLARAEEQRRLLEPHRLEVALQANANAYTNGSRVTAKGAPHNPDPDEIPTPSSLARAAAPSRTAAASRKAAVTASTAARSAAESGRATRPSSAGVTGPSGGDRPASAGAVDQSGDATQVISAIAASPTAESGRASRSTSAGAGRSSGGDRPASTGAADRPGEATQVISAIAASPAAVATAEIGSAEEEREAGDTGVAAVATPEASSAAVDHESGDVAESAEAEDPGAPAEASGDVPPHVEPSHEAVASYLAGVSRSAREVEATRPAETLVDGVAVDSPEAAPAKASRKRAPAKTKAEPKAARSRAKAKPRAKGPVAAQGDPAPGGTVFVAPAAKSSPAGGKVFVPRPKVEPEKPAAAATKASPARRKPRSRSEPQRVVIDPKKLQTLKIEAIPADKPPPASQP